jgi:hypothetical protein
MEGHYEAELINVLRQIRDELREMNGKDAEGRRRPGSPYTQTYPPMYPWQSPVVWGHQVSASGTGYIVNDHQDEKVAETAED